MQLNTKSNDLIIKCVEEKELKYKIILRKILIQYQGKEKIVT